MIDPNALVIQCLEAHAHYNAITQDLWYSEPREMAAVTMNSVIGEAFLMRSEVLTQS